MIHSVVLIAAIVAPAQKGYCNCGSSCVCGCQQGKDCSCLHDGKRLPPHTAPAKTPPKKTEKLPQSKVNQVAEKRETPKPAEEKRLIEGASGDAYPVQPDGVWNFGVDSSKIGKRPRFTFGEHEISKAEAMRLIEEGIPDDANKLRLTLIGQEADRKRVLADLEGPQFNALKNLYVVQAYEPSNPMIQNLGFVVGGRPTIYLQRPDGLVLHRQDEYEGADKLACAIRKADPNYDPNRDPDLTKPKPCPGPLGPGGFDLTRVPVWVWVILAIGLLLFLRDEGGNNKKEGKS